MSVIYGPQSGGGFNPLGLLGTVLSFVPGMQPFGMALGAANSLAKGKPMDAVMSMGKMGNNNIPNGNNNFNGLFGQIQGTPDMDWYKQRWGWK
jgi:hypothetical protein